MSDFKDKHPADVAAERGLVMVLPDTGQLFIDIDTETAEQQEMQMYRLLATLRHNGCPVQVEKITTSQNGGKHVYLRASIEGWDGDDPIIRAALQAMLGSDPVKEFLSLMRVLRKLDRPPSTLFEVPE